MARSTRPPARAYGVTPWSRAFLAAVDQSQQRRIAKARTYFRDRHVTGLTIGAGVVAAAVTGSQLDPFQTRLTMRTVDAATVVGLLSDLRATDDLMALARGEQPRVLGELIAPTESADVAVSCTCPIDDTCIHALAVAFEVAAEIDRRSTTLLKVMGVDLADLLAYRPGTGESGGPGDEPVVGGDCHAGDYHGADYHGDDTPLPALPAPQPFHIFTELDSSALRAALRASGVAALDVTEATDELALLYEHLTRWSR